MKKSNFFIFIMFGTLLLSCSEKTEKTIINPGKVQSLKGSKLNFERDSLHYNISLNKNQEKEFLVLKKIYVQDSCFGKFNDQKINEALVYIKDKNLIGAPYVKYFIEQKEKGIFKAIWTVHDFYDVMTYIEVSGNDQIGNGKGEILNVKLHDEATKEWQAMNFLNKDEKWILLSKEKQTATKYCNDTINKNINFSINGESFPKNEINFHNAFFEDNHSYFKCHDLKKT